MILGSNPSWATYFFCTIRAINDIYQHSYLSFPLLRLESRVLTALTSISEPSELSELSENSKFIEHYKSNKQNPSIAIKTEILEV